MRKGGGTEVVPLQLRYKKKDELLNAHLSTLEFVKTKKPHEVMKALEKSFQLGPIPLL